MAGKIPQGSAHQQENPHRSSNVERRVPAGQLEHTAGYEREGDRLWQDSEGRPQQKVAMLDGRESQEKVNKQPADGELAHAKDEKRRGVTVEMLL